MRFLGSGLTHLIFTAMQKRSAVGDSSPNAHACRSRRGEAPEGSSLLSPRVEARSAEDRGRGCQERYTTPPGCRTYQGVRQPVRHPCGVALSFVMPDPRVFGATPLDLVAKHMVYHPLSRLVPLFIQQRYDTNPAVRSTCSQKIYLLCLSGVEGLLSGAQKPLNDHVTNLQLGNGHPQGVLRSPPFIMSWWTSVLLKCVTPVNPCDIIALYLPFFVPLPRI